MGGLNIGMVVHICIVGDFSQLSFRWIFLNPGFMARVMVEDCSVAYNFCLLHLTMAGLFLDVTSFCSFHSASHTQRVPAHPTAAGERTVPT